MTALRVKRLRSQLVPLCAALAFIAINISLPTGDAWARTKPLVEMGDPDDGQEKPRSGPGNGARVEVQSNEHQYLKARLSPNKWSYVSSRQFWQHLMGAIVLWLPGSRH